MRGQTTLTQKTARDANDRASTYLVGGIDTFKLKTQNMRMENFRKKYAGADADANIKKALVIHALMYPDYDVDNFEYVLKKVRETEGAGGAATGGGGADESKAGTDIRDRAYEQAKKKVDRLSEEDMETKFKFNKIIVSPGAGQLIVRPGAVPTAHSATDIPRPRGFTLFAQEDIFSAPSCLDKFSQKLHQSLEKTAKLLSDMIFWESTLNTLFLPAQRAHLKSLSSSNLTAIKEI